MPRSYDTESAKKSTPQPQNQYGIVGLVGAIVLLSLTVAALGASVWLNEYIWTNVFSF